MAWVAPLGVALLGTLLIVVRLRGVVTEARAAQRSLSSLADLREPIRQLTAEAREVAARAADLQVARRPGVPPAP